MSEVQVGPEAPSKLPPKPSEQHSSYGKGFMIRMAVLLGLLFLVGGMFVYEKFVMIPHANQVIEEVSKLTDADSNDGHGIPRDKVRELMGRDPFKVEDNKSKINMDRKEGEAEKDATIVIETYKFPRILPFLKGGQFVTVVYRDLALSEVLPNQRFSMLNNPDNEKIYIPAESERDMPRPSVN